MKKAIVLAAGLGKRMNSESPKVLYPVAGRPMIEYVLDGLDAVGIDEIVVVVGWRGEEVRAALAGRKNLRWVEQTERLGTGHAVICCRDEIATDTGPVFIIAGDSPMIRAKSVQALFDAYEKIESETGSPPGVILGTVHKENPFGMGRIRRDAAGEFLGIVEEKDATDIERGITEINMSYYVFHTPDLLDALTKMTPNNVQKEYYLTDCPTILLRDGKVVRALPVLAPTEALGVNSPADVPPIEAALLGRRPGVR